MQESIKKAIKDYSINADDEAIEKLSTYAKEVIDKNKKINLISKKDEKNIIERHIIDSLIVLKFPIADELKNKEIIDIGSGAGFPAIPLSIVLKNARITLSEQRKKKFFFLIWIKQLLKLENIRILNQMIDKTHNNRYDIATQRATARFDDLYPIVSSLLNEKGIFISWMMEKDLMEIGNNKSPNFIYNYYLSDGVKRVLAIWRR
jgi:16S rRNA (guanine527-N7)-methyltransferase